MRYMGSDNLWSKYSYVWVTAGFFLLSLIGHWVFGWYAYVYEEAAHGNTPETQGYVIEMARDTLENWQSEFLQLMWQVAGLAFLLYIGSPQSKEGDDRKEEKLDLILKAVAKDGAQRIEQLDKKYPRTG